MRLAYSEGLGFFCERIDIRKISLESSAVEKIGNSEFQKKAPNYYNFDVIISISLSDEMTIKATTKAVIKYLEAGNKEKTQGRNFICLWIRSRTNRLRSLPRITKGWLWLRSYGTDNNV